MFSTAIIGIVIFATPCVVLELRLHRLSQDSGKALQGTKTFKLVSNPVFVFGDRMK